MHIVYGSKIQLCSLKNYMFEMRDALIYISHICEERIIARFKELSDDFGFFGDSFFIYTGCLDADAENCLKSYSVRYSHVDVSNLNDLGYTPIKETIVPGSNHFILMWFYHHFPEYRYYWNIEYDVVYTGKWKDFFELNIARTSDLLSCHIKTYHNDVSWYWWNAYFSVNMPLPVEQRIRSFNPIMRLSYKALKALHDFLKDGSYGHHEVLIPSFLFHSGFTIEDFGGHGEFTPSEYLDNFYLDDKNHRTMRFRPLVDLMSEKLIVNKLYHPVK